MQLSSNFTEKHVNEVIQHISLGAVLWGSGSEWDTGVSRSWTQVRVVISTKKKKKTPSQHTLPTLSKVSLPVASRQTTWGTAHISPGSAWQERAGEVQPTFYSCCWKPIGWLIVCDHITMMKKSQQGLPIVVRLEFFFAIYEGFHNIME